ncbi:hypothetical protein Y032_0362g3506 [Ancylostoma ceylanicum]|uniref:Uncharacterized protein n=1 Tax=Ancylostoma ceylanicum TaxID=53326 RepID=A0A016RVF8_9BILA|nr:hypothetical protein Y032_0362g3506 [Ancylostoma ceylanicum]
MAGASQSSGAISMNPYIASRQFRAAEPQYVCSEAVWWFSLSTDKTAGFGVLRLDFTVILLEISWEVPTFSATSSALLLESPLPQ